MAICKRCKREFNQVHKIQLYCPDCNDYLWAEWEDEHVEELEQIKVIQANGHPHHCACRQVWGDGECECDLYEKGYNPYAWMKNNKVTAP